MFAFLKKLFGVNTAPLQQALQQGAVVIDVRTPAEFRSGHVAGSKNIPLNEIKAKTEQIRKWNKPVITVCQSGGRSRMAQTMLAAAGIKVCNGGGWAQFQKIMQL